MGGATRRPSGVWRRGPIWAPNFCGSPGAVRDRCGSRARSASGCGWAVLSSRRCPGFRSTVLGWRCAPVSTAALRHGVDPEDIHDASVHALAVDEIGEDPFSYLVLGPDRAEHLLELVVLDRPTGRLSSMRCRCGRRTDDYCREAGEGYGGQAEGECGRARRGARRGARGGGRARLRRRGDPAASSRRAAGAGFGRGQCRIGAAGPRTEA